MYLIYNKITGLLILCVMCTVLRALAAQDSFHVANRLSESFTKGRVQGVFRTAFVSNINDGPLTDYYAWAAGGSLKFETATFHHFGLGIGGSFTYNLTSSDLGAADPITGQRSRYELLLMDIEDPYNRTNMYRMDWLYLKYKFKKGYLCWGKQTVTTPFINYQDVFMRGSVVDGLYGNMQLSGKMKIELGYIYGISPNATTRWFHVGESVGVFPNGYSTNGSLSGYLNNVNSDGMLFTGLHIHPSSNLIIQLWDQYVDQVFNTVLLQADYILYKPQPSNTIIMSVQSIRQDALASGGNSDASKAYYARGNYSWVLGGRISYRTSQLDVSANYTHITGDGRYQMPREWGREPMFTFLMREQIEGAGDVHATSVRCIYTTKKHRMKFDAGIGYYNMPDVQDARLSKYGMPSYIQYCALARYLFGKKLKGLEVELLYMYKQGLQPVGTNYKFIINKVDMSQFGASMRYKI